MNVVILAAICLFLSLKSFGAETDNFSNRKVPLADASQAVNGLITSYINQAIAAYKKDGNQGCNENALLTKYLRIKLDTNFPDIYGAIEGSSQISKGQASRIYSDSEIWGGSASTININGTLVGSDKIDHLLSHGYYYYLKANKTGNVNDALELGISQENGCWGLACNKVKSYGDLAANYQGFLFWSKIFDDDDGFIVCEKGNFVLKKSIRIQDFVTDAMDEAINCSSFASQAIATKVKENITAMGYKSCPVEPKKCETLLTKYSKLVASKILHPACSSLGRTQDRFVESPGPRIGLSILPEIEAATDGVKFKNLLKGIGVF